MKMQIKQSDLNHRNPVARAMARDAAQFRSRVVRDRTKYSRKTKHKKGEW
jgi:hypothetical protein